MMPGVVNLQLEAILLLTVVGPSGPKLVQAVLDTGFRAELCLPRAVADSLGLVAVDHGVSILADGSSEEYDIANAQVLWDDALRDVVVWIVGPEVLVGMELLAGHEVRLEVEPSGAAEVRPLP